MSNLVLSSDSNLLILTETWLTDDITDNEVLADLPNFTLFRSDRKNARGGGVLIAARRHLSCTHLNVSSDLEIIWLICRAAPESVLLGVCYRPPHKTPNFSRQLNDILATLTTEHPNAHILLFGDFNYPTINWDNNAHTVDNRAETREFIDICSNFDLTQLVLNPTRVVKESANILDLILTNHPESLSSITYLREISDHKVIHAVFNFIPAPRHNPGKTIRLYDKGNYEALDTELRAFFPSYQASFQSRSIQQNWTIFKEKFSALADTFIPKITFHNNRNQPWFTKSLKKLESKKKRLFRAAKNNPSNNAWDKYYIAENTYLSAIKSAKRSFYQDDLSKILRNNPKKFWQIINPNNTASVTLNNDSGEPLSDSECANMFSTAFSSVFTSEPDTPLPTLPTTITRTMPTTSVSVTGIVSLIDNLNLSSSAGTDEINSKLLKNTKYISAEYLSLLFAQSLSTGTMPDDWKKGKVVPVYKSGNKNSPLNYRPISLTSVPCKIMEHIIYSEIMRFLDTNKFLHPAQHGFRKNLSCTTQLALFLHDLHANLDLNIQTDAIFLDFAKAFDKVSHRRLLLKLAQLNLHPNILNWIREFLTFRFQSVTVNQRSSNPVPVTSGVPQGSVLGPLLFLIYINDLPHHLSCNIRLFADDCVIYRSITSTSDQNALQDDLNRVEKWCDDWLMTLNPSKCKLISFHRRHNPFSSHYTITKTPVDLTQSNKYLGIIIRHDLSWREHVASIISSANKTLGFLKRHLRHATKEVKLLAYNTLVRPRLEYASPIWSPHQAYLIDALEAVQNRAARFIHSQYSYQISVSSLKSQSNLRSLSFRRRVATLSLFHKFYYSSLGQEPYICAPPPRISHRTGHPLQVTRPRARTVTFSSSFFPRAASDWNGLSLSVAAITCPSSFNASIETYAPS